MKKYKTIYMVLLLLMISLLVGGGVYISQRNNEDEYTKIMKIQKGGQQERNGEPNRPTISYIPRPITEETNTP